MNAIEITQPGDVDQLAPTARAAADPKAGEVRIRNHAAGLNFVDLLLRSGALPPGAVSYPIVPGVEGAGTIEAVGQDVQNLSIGDRVMWFGGLDAGGYGASVTVPAHGVATIPEAIAFIDAAAVPVAAITAYHMLHNLTDVTAGDWVLVHKAAGGVGSMATQLARAAGLKTVALARSDKHAFVATLEPDVLLDDRADDLGEQIHQATGGTGIAVSLNSTGGPSLARDLDLLHPFGTVINYGFLNGPPDDTLGPALTAHFGKSPSVRLSDIYTHYRERPTRFAKDLARIADLLATGKIQPLTNDVMPLSEVSEAHRRLESGAVTGKLVLTIPQT